MTKAKTTSRERLAEHYRKKQEKEERIAGLQALAAEWEIAGNIYEARKLQVKIRLVQQELRYMGDEYPHL